LSFDRIILTNGSLVIGVEAADHIIKVKKEDFREGASFRMSENLTLAQCDRILRKSGVNRVGGDAATELAQTLEEIGTMIAMKAAESVRRDGRMTLKRRDVTEAAELILAISKLHRMPDRI